MLSRVVVAGSLAFAVIISFAGLVGATAPIDKPDLDVTFISQTPRYAALHSKVGYHDHGKPYFLKPEDAKLGKLHPDEGEKITFTAHFMNKGAELKGEVGFVWKFDGKEFKTGKIAVPAYGEVAETAVVWPWEEGPHTVTFEVDPGAKVEDFARWNNTKTDRTDALGFFYFADKATYDRWNAEKNFLGTYSLEDWVNWHFDEMNREFEAAVYPSTPNGCSERVRMDTFVALEEGEKIEDYDRSNYQGYWASTGGGDGWDKDCMALCHEMGHQIGLIDYYLLVLFPHNNRIRDMYGQPIMEGYKWPLSGNMFGPGARAWNEVSAAALDKAKGYPRGYYGIYLFDHADNYSIRVLDREGNPLPNARITYYRYAERMLKEQEGDTDSKGVLDLKNYDSERYKIPFSPFEMKPTPFGKIRVVGTDSIICFQVQSHGQEDFIMTDTLQFLVENWRAKDHKHVTVDINTRIGPKDGPQPPNNVKATWNDAGSILISWMPPEKSEGLRYNVYRSNLYGSGGWMMMEPELFGDKVEGTEFVYNCIGDPDRSGMRFFVTSVDAKGREGGLSRRVWAEYPPRRDYAMQIVYDAPRDRIAMCRDSGMITYSESMGFEPITPLSSYRAMYGAAVNRDGNLIVANPPAGCASFYDLSVWTAGYPSYQYALPKGDEKIQNPRDVAVDGQGYVVITDTGGGRVLVLTRTKKIAAVLGGAGEGDSDGKIVEPISVAILPDERIVVGDAALDCLVTCRIKDDGSVDYSTLPGKFPKPVDLVVDSHGNLIVVDQEAKNVTVLSGPSYTESRTVAENLANPLSAAIYKNGTILVYAPGKLGMDAFVKLEGALASDAMYYISFLTREEALEFCVLPEAIQKKHAPLIDREKWMIIGTFGNTDAKGFDIEYGPEKEEKAFLGGKHDGIGGKVEWSRIPERVCPDGELFYLGNYSSPQYFACIYVTTTIMSDSEKKVRILTGSDDTITMWVNGEKVLAKNVSRGVKRDEDKTDVVLKKGENRVLIKVCQGIGGWGLAFRIVDPETDAPIQY